MKNFIEAKDIKTIENPIIIDARKAQEDRSSLDIYKDGHLEGAFYFDTEKDMASVETKTSGAHPIPKIEDFKASLERTGATKNSHFVIYDDGTNTTGPRLWFLLKYFGIEKVQLVNGGYPAIKIAGLKITREVTNEKKGEIHLQENPSLLATYEEVLDHSKNKSVAMTNEKVKGKILLDSRTHERYLGLEEPLYNIAGHIPSSYSYFFGDNFDEEGKIKGLDQIKERFGKLAGKDIIVSCGSGVTACANLIAMDEVGIPARLYNGSYSQWIKLGNPVDKGKDKEE